MGGYGTIKKRGLAKANYRRHVQACKKKKRGKKVGVENEIIALCELFEIKFPQTLPQFDNIMRKAVKLGLIYRREFITLRCYYLKYFNN